jgi:hypothetical protein
MRLRRTRSSGRAATTAHSAPGGAEVASTLGGWGVQADVPRERLGTRLHSPHLAILKELPLRSRIPFSAFVWGSQRIRG